MPGSPPPSAAPLHVQWPWTHSGVVGGQHGAGAHCCDPSCPPGRRGRAAASTLSGRRWSSTCPRHPATKGRLRLLPSPSGPYVACVASLPGWAPPWATSGHEGGRTTSAPGTAARLARPQLPAPVIMSFKKKKKEGKCLKSLSSACCCCWTHSASCPVKPTRGEPGFSPPAPACPAPHTSQLPRGDGHCPGGPPSPTPPPGPAPPAWGPQALMREHEWGLTARG